MSHTTTPATTHHEPPAKVKPELLVALMATDWLHGDRHFAAQIQDMAMRMLKDLGAEGEEALGRLEGLPTGIRAAQDQPAMRQDEHRMAQPTKAA